MPSSVQLELATHQLGFSYSLAGGAYSTQPSVDVSGRLAELQLRIYWQNKANFSQLGHVLGQDLAELDNKAEIDPKMKNNEDNAKNEEE